MTPATILPGDPVDIGKLARQLSAMADAVDSTIGAVDAVTAAANKQKGDPAASAAVKSGKQFHDRLVTVSDHIRKAASALTDLQNRLLDLERQARTAWQYEHQKQKDLIYHESVADVTAMAYQARASCAVLIEQYAEAAAQSSSNGINLSKLLIDLTIDPDELKHDPLLWAVTMLPWFKFAKLGKLTELTKLGQVEHDASEASDASSLAEETAAASKATSLLTKISNLFRTDHLGPAGTALAAKLPKGTVLRVTSDPAVSAALIGRRVVPVWRQNAADRGFTLENVVAEMWSKTHNIGPNSVFAALPQNNRDIDFITWLGTDGANVTQVKSIDLAATSYQDPSKLKALITGYASHLTDPTAFNAGYGLSVSGRWVGQRELVLVVPDTAIEAKQAEAISEAYKSAQAIGIDINIVEVPR